MKFNKIDRENWVRKEYFEHYLQQQTTFSITNEMNITVLMENLRKKNYKLYPAFIFMVTKIVNSHREFRTSFNQEGNLGYWSEIVPSYTIFDKKTNTFSSIWSPNASRFSEFHSQYEKDVEEYNGTGSLFPKTPIPDNYIPISMIPWSSFTAFNLNINNGGDFLLPIITGGKYSQIKDEWFLPVSLQIHHAVSDGYHASVFMNEFQRFADESADWL
ncbi:MULTISPECIES: type A chloramphenicol O-acetyltransferase [unclassified Bacillus (in: firmicutes)]|uniref:type A chloramphenicol O-acetyltransferase n=1 Tax=unclassified Bacillus (in: firmicutes) TaxID=185979 RepID=UPI001BEACD1C|nr:MULTISPECIES: type A chloramphenicol O-acetyltransferase [unclassified Bacillus (in: firmicutes)]MBT2617403.1 type A chloramphenicol O-acetyltransferase [Bacillus sp. ISL-78]MBT2630905.1 type A chloramphenicol O-acetyltransferase [Bacillus sp. ISL-101]